MKTSRVKKFVMVLAVIAGMVGIGAVPPAGADAVAETVTPCEGESDSVVRLYQAAFRRPAEQSGFDFWMVSYTSGTMSLTQIANFFSASDELQSLYGELTDAEYVDRIYRNVLDRGPDAGGLAFWIGEMDDGMSRGTLLLRFSESPEFVTTTGTVAPTLGFYNDGYSDVWDCLVDTSLIESVTAAFATAVADGNTAWMSILSGEVVTLDPALPDLELGDPALFGDPVEIDYPWCEPIGDFSQDCYWFLLEGGDMTWTLRMTVTPEGIEQDGSGFTGRYLVGSFTLTKVSA